MNKNLRFATLIITAVFLLMALTLVIGEAGAAEVTLAWDSPVPDGYRIYCAPIGQPIDYTAPVKEVLVTDDFEYQTTATVPEGVIYCVARAFRGEDESADSNVAVKDPSQQVAVYPPAGVQ